MSGPPRTLRAFLALEIPEEVRDALAAQQQRLRRELPPARWVRPDKQHLTIRFLGDATEDVLGALAAELAPALAELPGVEVELGGSGFFPTPKRPRVAWIGGRANGVEEVVDAVERAVVGHGFAAERKPWRLHLTQARLRSAWPRQAVDRFLQWGRELALPRFSRRRVVLYSSTLTPSGAVYTPLVELPLR